VLQNETALILSMLHSALYKYSNELSKLEFWIIEKSRRTDSSFSIVFLVTF